MGVITGAGTELAISAAVPATDTEAGFEALTYTRIAYASNLGTYGPTTELQTFNALFEGEIQLKGTTRKGQMNPVIALDRSDAGQALAIAAAADPTDEYSIRVTFSNGEKDYMRVQVLGVPKTVGDSSSPVTWQPIFALKTLPIEVSAA